MTTECKILIFACATLLLLPGFRLAGTGNAQDIIGVTGADIGGLAPWDIPAPTMPADAGLARRLADIIRPHTARMNAREARLRDMAQTASDNPMPLLDAIERELPDIGRDILAIIAVIRKHTRETTEWEGYSAHHSPEEALSMGHAVMNHVLEAHDMELSSADIAAQLHWSAVAWQPLAAGIELHPAEQWILEAMALEPQWHAADPVWTWVAFLSMLRNTRAATGARLYPATELRDVLHLMDREYLTPYKLGGISAAEQFHYAVELLLGASVTAALYREDMLQQWKLEGGEFVFASFHAYTAESVRASLESAWLSAVMRNGFVDADSSAGEITKAYESRRGFFAVLAAESNRRARMADGDAADSARLYGYYLLLLARFPPCLSVYRLEQVNENWLRFVEGYDITSDTNTDRETAARPAADGQLISAEPDGIMTSGISYPCLVQADYRRDDDGVWQWRPRAAGARHHLDRFLNRTGADAGTTSR